MLYTLAPSPVGELLLAGDGQALTLVSFPTGSKARAPAPDWERRDDAFAEPKRQLAAYFAGDLKRFDLNCRPNVTAFQGTVLDELRRIPYGETRSYGELAERIGRAGAARAVASANARNPLPIICPCHRVVGADGSLTGFGGGLPTKRFLLDLERRCAAA